MVTNREECSYLVESFLGCSSVVHFSVISWQKSTVTVWLLDFCDLPYSLPSVSLSAPPFLAAVSTSPSEGPGEPRRRGSGVAEAERVVRSMLAAMAAAAAAAVALGWRWAAAVAVELAGRSTGQ